MNKCREKENRLGMEKLNNQGCPMKIIGYNSSEDIVVQFQDKYKAEVRTQYCNFKSGSIKNPYYPSVYGVGIIGEKYPVSINCIVTKENEAWRHIIQRSYDIVLKNKQPTYKNVSCCNEWLNYENFYEWLNSQLNFDKWYNGYRWAVDKDILIKRNEIYSPDTCCLVPQNVNCLFLKREAERGKYPIGVRENSSGFIAKCHNPFTNKSEDLGIYSTPEKAFYLGYKPFKEDIIKRVAQIEYNNKNITKQCYEAMMNYQVEIDD